MRRHLLRESEASDKAAQTVISPLLGRDPISHLSVFAVAVRNIAMPVACTIVDKLAQTGMIDCSSFSSIKLRIISNSAVCGGIIAYQKPGY
jgi:hypothetical protein